MTDRPQAVRRVLGVALAAGVWSGPLAAQDAAALSDRARRAFDILEPAASASEQAEARAVAARVADDLEVELITTTVVEIGGRRLIAARVLEPGRDSNVAFLVQTLVLDPESGRVLGVFPGTEDEIGALPALAEDAPASDDPPEAGRAE